LPFLHLDISSASFLLLSHKQIQYLHPLSQVIQNYISLSLSCENPFLSCLLVLDVTVGRRLLFSHFTVHFGESYLLAAYRQQHTVTCISGCKKR